MMHRAFRIAGFPPWLFQVEAKFGNQIAETGELLCDGELSTDRPINTMGSVDGKQI